MSPEIKTYLFDILKSIEEIDSFFEGQRDFNFFKKDIKTKRAVERNLEIIGEAASRIYKIDQEVNLPNIRKIIDTRNRIIHGYDTVSDEIIWVIINEYLSELKSHIETIFPESL